MANKFASSINEVKNSKLLGIASTNFFRLKSFGEKYNIDKKYRYKNYDEILNCNEINAIYISTLNNTHAEIVIKAAKAKKNILCEKTIATNYNDTIKIFETLNKSDVFFLEAIAYRSHKQTKFVLAIPNNLEFFTSFMDEANTFAMFPNPIIPQFITIFFY